MKIAVVGGGSTYTPELVDGFARLAPDVTELALVDPATLREVDGINEEARLLMAVWVGNTRLLDNTLLSESLLCCV